MRVVELGISWVLGKVIIAISSYHGRDKNRQFNRIKEQINRDKKPCSDN